MHLACPKCDKSIHIASTESCGGLSQAMQPYYNELLRENQELKAKISFLEKPAMTDMVNRMFELFQDRRDTDERLKVVEAKLKKITDILNEDK